MMSEKGVGRLLPGRIRFPSTCLSQSNPVRSPSIAAGNRPRVEDGVAPSLKLGKFFISGVNQEALFSY